MRWTTVVPVLALIALVFTWGRDLPGFGVAAVAILLAGAVLAAVHHAEVIAHKVGEPFGSLVLAVAVTIIEVALIVSVMVAGTEKGATLARDTAFAAVMICVTGITGLCLLVAALRLVLLPETLAAVRAARLDRTQTSLNLALGSATASIGLTIPAVAVASVVLDVPLVLGLGPTQMVLLTLSIIISTLTIVPGRATVLQGGLHLAVFAAFLFLTVTP